MFQTKLHAKRAFLRNPNRTTLASIAIVTGFAAAVAGSIRVAAPPAADSFVVNDRVITETQIDEALAELAGDYRFPAPEQSRRVAEQKLIDEELLLNNGLRHL